MIRSLYGVFFSIIFMLLLFGDVSAWTISRDFEGGVVGEQADSHSSGLDSCVPKFTFSDLRSKTGAKAGKLDWEPGATARGGRLVFPSDLQEGDEVWYRTYMYFDSGFNWSADPAVKIMRLWTASQSGDNQGYISIYKRNHSVDPEIQLNNEPYTGGVTVSGTGETFDNGKWQCLELYVKFSASQNGIVRIWKDGELIGEDTKHNTMAELNSKSTFAYVMSWWNGGCQAYQAQWVDDIIITNERPSNQDSQGNYMIGPADDKFQQHLPIIEQLKVGPTE